MAIPPTGPRAAAGRPPKGGPRRFAAGVLTAAVLTLGWPAALHAEAGGAAEAPALVAAADHGTGSDSSHGSSLQLADLDGVWRRLEATPDERGRLEAIESAVAPLTWVVRKMAGGVLRSTTAPRPTLHFVWDGARLHERVPVDRGVDVRPVDPDAGTVKAIDGRGEPFEGAWEWTPEGLRFSWRQHQAHGTNHYRLDPAKRSLTVDHAIHVTAIDGVRPILYRSQFRKDEPAAVSAGGSGTER